MAASLHERMLIRKDGMRKHGSRWRVAIRHGMHGTDLFLWGAMPTSPFKWRDPGAGLNSYWTATSGGCYRRIMSREYPRYPIPAVGAVVWQGEQVLLVRRGKEPGMGLWSIPGGGVRLGERLEEAVRREMREETGLRVRPVRPIHVVERILPDELGIRYHYIIIDYACRVEGGDLTAASDAQEARWFAPGELSGLGLSEETLRVIELARPYPSNHRPPSP